MSERPFKTSDLFIFQPESFVFLKSKKPEFFSLGHPEPSGLHARLSSRGLLQAEGCAPVFSLRILLGTAS